MGHFDHITSKPFREALEADYLELQSCLEACTWKSLHVLAGSIVEALLIDYLLCSKHPDRPTKDPLRWELADAIEQCRREKVVSDRTANLCSVVRDYRNLIHPGRMVRLGEPAPSQRTGEIARALVDIIKEELVAARRAATGLTGEQVLSKLLRDASSLTILPHLLLEVSDEQRERLLLELIPRAHKESLQDDERLYDDCDTRLEKAFRLILESSADPIRKQVAAEFVRIIREEDGEAVARYGAAFFRSRDLPFVPSPNEALVRDHLLGLAPTVHTVASLRILEGIGPFLTPRDVRTWLDPVIRALVKESTKEANRERAHEYLLTEVATTDPEVDKAIDVRLEDWLRHYEKAGDASKADYVRTLAKEVEDLRLQVPF